MANRVRRFTQRRRRRTAGNSSRLGSLPGRWLSILSYIFTSLAFLVVLIIAYYWHSNPTAINSSADALMKLPLLKGVGEYMKANHEKTVGSLLYSGTLLSTAPTSLSLGLAIVSILAVVYIIPKATFLEYLTLAVLTAVVLRVKGQTAKLITLLVMVVTLFAGWWGASFLA